MFAEDRNNPEAVKAFRDNGKRKALIIAVSEYDKQSKLGQLSFCKKDGEAVYKVLKHQYEIPDKWRLIGNVEGQIIKDAIYDFFRESAEKDDTLFFFTFLAMGFMIVTETPFWPHRILTRSTSIRTVTILHTSKMKP